MINSIIKKTNLDECSEHATKDLGDSSLFDLSRVCIRQSYFSFLSSYYNHQLFPFASDGEDKSPSG